MDFESGDSSSLSKQTFNFRATIGNKKKLLKVLLPLAIIQVVMALLFLVIKVYNALILFMYYIVSTLTHP